ncbi:MAG: DNA repair protein RecO [Acidobacteriota bacterium]|nr:DNA repair protein RecO [Acidobacteriota bacterium]
MAKARVVRQRVDQAYVVKTQALGDFDLIVTLLAENAGVIRGVARAARRSRRRFGGALEPLTRVSVRWEVREGRDLQRIDSLEARRSYAALQSDPVLQAGCAVLAELWTAVSREEQPDPKGFRLIGSVLDALEKGMDPLVAVRYFEYWTLRLHGLLPELGVCHVCGRELPSRTPRFSQRGVGIVCRGCVGAVSAPAEKMAASDFVFLETVAKQPPTRIEAERSAVMPGGALELLLRGTLEAYVERRFRTYRHLYLAASGTVPGSSAR